MSLILASSSPRRQELLASLGLKFTVKAASLDESPCPGEKPNAYVERLAREKARCVAAVSSAGAFVLAADTIVVVDKKIFGKPGAAPQEGAKMLWCLSDRTHQVLTGVAVIRNEHRLAHHRNAEAVNSLVVTTDVHFKALTMEEVNWYLSTGEGQDKAGGYALQGYGGAFITTLSGSHSNVIGLPLVETTTLLSRSGFRLPWNNRQRFKAN